MVTALLKKGGSCADVLHNAVIGGMGLFFFLQVIFCVFVLATFRINWRGAAQK